MAIDEEGVLVERLHLNTDTGLSAYVRHGDLFAWANVIAALAFAAGHLPAAMYLLNVQSPLELPVVVLAELAVLNGLVELVAGERYMRDGLVAAMGVHFWADVVWHVV